MDVESSRFSAENGRGSAGVLDLKTKMGDDRWRFGGTNFIPGVSTEGGLHVNKWTPRLEFPDRWSKAGPGSTTASTPSTSNDLIHGLPRGQNRTSGVTASNLSRFQVNLTPANILTGSFLFNLADINRTGLSFLNPVEATTNHRQALYMSTLRDQAYFGGALLDVGFADSRGDTCATCRRATALTRSRPSATWATISSNLEPPLLPAAVDRQPVPADACTLLGTHQLKFGIDFEREAFHQTVLLHDYEILRDGQLAWRAM